MSNNKNILDDDFNDYRTEKDVENYVDQQIQEFEIKKILGTEKKSSSSKFLRAMVIILGLLVVGFFYCIILD